MSTKLDHNPNSDKKSALLAVSGGLDSIVLLHLLVTEVTSTKKNREGSTL
jgi:tRNA(Ile)-lysidine synthase TilS/MesJ